MSDRKEHCIIKERDDGYETRYTGEGIKVFIYGEEMEEKCDIFLPNGGGDAHIPSKGKFYKKWFWEEKLSPHSICLYLSSEHNGERERARAAKLKFLLASLEELYER